MSAGLNDAFYADLAFVPRRQEIVSLLPERVLLRLGTRLDELIAQAEASLRPAFCIRACPLAADGAVEGVVLPPVIWDEREGVCRRVFAYAATGGQKQGQSGNVLEEYIWGQLALLAHGQAIAAMIKAAGACFGVARCRRFCPGTVAGWPTEKLADVFRLLGELPAAIGVELTGAGMMTPLRSSAGIFTDSGAEQRCCLCDMKNCGERKAPFRGGGGK